MKRKRLLEEFILFWKELEAHYLLARVLSILYRKLFHFHIDVRAAAVAYNFTLAVFPTIIFLFSLLPYLPIEHFDEKLMSFIQDIVPKNLRSDLQAMIVELTSKKRGGILSIGFFLALYASTSGIMALIRSFNITYKTSENRGFIKERLIALGLNFLLTFVLIVSFSVFIIGNFLVDYLGAKGLISYNFTYYLLSVLTYLLTFSVFFFTISILYYWAPAIHKRWKFFNIGSITASILTILATNLFFYFLVNFASYHKVYGSIGSLIALMVWLYFIALILLVGFEINASIDQAKTEEEEESETEFLRN